MVTAIIKWDFVPGSYGTIVEYKLASDSAWTTPTSPSNPTLDNEYPINISENIFYDVKITIIGKNGPCRSYYQQIYYASPDICCPATYIKSPDSTYCYKYLDISPTPPSSSENAIEKNNIAYGQFGTLIYAAGFNIDGSGSNSRISLSNPFWVNGDGGGGGIVDTVQGPLNRTGVWSTTEAAGQTVGYSVCLNIPAPATYYIGVGGDNEQRIYVDGTLILNMNPSIMAAYLNANGYPGVDVQCTFKFWHIYPVTLTAGFHVLEIIGFNVSSVAAFGTEVYNATSAEIATATSYAALGSKLIFSTKDVIGQPIILGSGGIGYTCPSGYSLVLCDGSPKCRQILTTSTIPC